MFTITQIIILLAFILLGGAGIASLQEGLNVFYKYFLKTYGAQIHRKPMKAPYSAHRIVTR